MFWKKLVKREAEASLPTKFGQFKVYAFRELQNGREHIALVMGRIKSDETVLVRVHSRCLTGDVFASRRCDCQKQLWLALKIIKKRGQGVLVYLNQEGRGIGLINKIKSYALQEQGMDTVEANLKLGYVADLRNYDIGAQILQDLGVGKIELMTNNPRKIEGIRRYGLQIVKRVPLEVPADDYNRKYLSAKRDKLGHLLY